MEHIRGTNLGNWLVLEKWMQPELFEGTDAEDEIWLNRKMDQDCLAERLETHRKTYITKRDFEVLAENGINLVRIPVPYFIFGDRPPLSGCIQYLDCAFDWAEQNGIRILVDLHTVPGSQNGYDNGGLTGVCKWHKTPKEVEYALHVLERLAERYKGRSGLYGIEVLNEPISLSVWLTSPSRIRADDKEEAKGSGHIPMTFLKGFYKQAYERLRKILPEEKKIVFHDGFRLGRWKDFFVKNGMKGVVLDTHIYIFAMESFVPIHKPWVYRIYIEIQKWLIERAQKYTPVIVGEWCICNRYAEKMDKTIMEEEKQRNLRKERYLMVAGLQSAAWEQCEGDIYWSYQFARNIDSLPHELWKESWELRRCWKYGWLQRTEKAGEHTMEQRRAQ